MNEKHSILFLVPYFGEWPPWLGHFLNSCRENPSFSWVLISDAPKPVNLPGNVNWYPADLEEISEKVSEIIGKRVQITHPYKICDYRPAFGEIFKDLIGDHPFWGYNDLDIILGDVKKFLTPERLERYDVFSVRKNYMTGHFAVYRNIPMINRLFWKIPGVKKVFFRTGLHYALDERSRIAGKPLERNPFPAWYNSMRYHFKHIFGNPVRDMTTLLQSLEKKGEVRWFHKDLVRSDKWFSDRNVMEWEVLWEKGKLYDLTNNEELLHFHFLLSKREPVFLKNINTPSSRFVISRQGILPVDQSSKL